MREGWGVTSRPDPFAPPAARTRRPRKSSPEDRALRAAHAVTERRLRSLGFFYLARGLGALLFAAVELRRSGVDGLVVVGAVSAGVATWAGLRLDGPRPDALVWVIAATIVEGFVALISGLGLLAVPALALHGAVLWYVLRPGPRAVLDPAYRAVIDRTAETRAPIAWWGYALGLVSIVASAAWLFAASRG